MKDEYIVDDDYMSQKGVNLNDYALEGTLIPAIINIGLDLLITRICYLDDSIKNGEMGVEEYLDKNQQRIGAFKKAQYRIIYNLLFTNETSPTDAYIDNIIVFEIGLGKINGWQKGIYYRHERQGE